MTDDPLWLGEELILAIHNEMLRQHGGAEGVRDKTLLESAIARPRHLFDYGDSELHSLAAAYAFGIANNHPFIDGKKRTAFLAAYTFLGINGLQLVAPEAEAATATLGLADKSITQENYARWLRDNTKPMAP